MSVLSRPALAVTAREIQAGDFTTFTGFRRVSSVQHVEESFGRGSKKRTRVASARLYRHDGLYDTLDVGDGSDDEPRYTIYR